MAIASRMSKLESEMGRLRQKIDLGPPNVSFESSQFSPVLMIDELGGFDGWCKDIGVARSSKYPRSAELRKRLLGGGLAGITAATVISLTLVPSSNNGMQEYARCFGLAITRCF
ncbi:hypothetical protein F0562_032307 [Nyssa sinensis]|uniref:Uncharacterized protein n=1 Tax=Nyssa sinensis TaxID=561372 RepID=A0A5J5APP0_9ASTE|nr:hypothetical protein F0562_032307 [Nyssa sinensis]